MGENRISNLLYFSQNKTFHLIKILKTAYKNFSMQNSTYFLSFCKLLFLIEMIIFSFRREYFRINLQKKIIFVSVFNAAKHKQRNSFYKQLNIVENKIVNAAFSQEKIYQICFFITKQKENNRQPSITIKQNKKQCTKLLPCTN